MIPAPETLHRPALLLSVMIACAIAALSFVPVVELPGPAQPQTTQAAHTQHLVAYGALVFPALATRPASALWVLPAALAWGAAIELLQPFVGRERSLEDVIANGVGIGIGTAAGVAVHWLLGRLRR
jgi:VanZ family protein